jgi:dihydroorotase
MSSHKLLRLLAATALVLTAPAGAATRQQGFDLVIANGRVIDPESGLDAVRHLGIRGDRIVSVSAEPLGEARDTIDARGLVVGPGFIDLHRHGHGDDSYRRAVRDGVTSVFEIEAGPPDIDRWYRFMGPARLINFGAGVGHIGARMQVLGDRGFMLPTGPGRGAATPEQVAEILKVIDTGLEAGAVAVGLGVSYTPGASADEFNAVVRRAAAQHALVMAHLGNGVSRLRAVLDSVAAAGASIHIAHINSTAGDEIRAWLDVLVEARAKGVDVTAEVYPYTASASLIQSAIFDGWEQRPDEWFARLQWAATGERLTRETFARYRAQGGSVISHSNTEDVLRVSVADPLPMFGSDGGRDLEDRATHPRASGTFSRILGHYVRDEKILTLTDALRRMTIEPARRLESRVPEMRERGRVRAGAFADITIFDPAIVIDRATYTKAGEYSAGIVHVLVNGVPVVRDSEFSDRGELYGQRVVVGLPMAGRPIRAAPGRTGARPPG